MQTLHRTRATWRAVAWASVIALLCGVALVQEDAEAGLSLADLRKRWLEKKRKRSEVEEKLRTLKKKQRTAADELREAGVALDKAERDLTYISRQLRETERKLAKTEEELTAVETRLDRRTEVLGARLRAIQRNGSVGYLELLLSARSFTELVRRTYLFQQIVGYDTALIKGIKAERKSLEEHKATLRTQRDRQKRLKVQFAVRTAAVDRQKEKHEETLNRITHDRKQQETLIAILDSEAKSIQARMAAASKRSKSSPSAPARRGDFIKPVSGRFTSGYGMRRHPILKRNRMHTGVDWAASRGTTIRAAAAGKVHSVDTLRGFGKTVIIDHSNGKQTLYAHCSRIVVRRGTTVKQGQKIAEVGSTGWSTGPHLHFEIWLDGKPTNPLPYLK